MAVEKECGVVTLDGACDCLGSVDQRPLIARFEA